MKVLVAGIGNIFFSDDGFGVEVAQRLATEPAPLGAKIQDFGIRGVHLAYELLDGYDVLVLIDALRMGEAPGTVVLVEPDLSTVEESDAADDSAPTLDPHSMSPMVVLNMLAGLGGRVDRVVVVGCQPADLHEGIGLSAPVSAAVDAAVTATKELLADLCGATERKTSA